MAADASVMAGPRARHRWLLATLLVTVVPIAAVALTAPAHDARPAAGLGWALFVGSSVHVGSTAWFYTVPEVRAHMRAHVRRFLLAPAALVVAAAAVAAALSPEHLAWLLLAFFAWQFFHFQKQNLGVSALAARAYGAPGLTPRERVALIAAGLGAVLSLLGRPGLLQVAGVDAHDGVFYLGAAIFVLAVAAGVFLLSTRPTQARPPQFSVTYLTALAFFSPVFVFSSPYAAVAGLTIAHGLQYLLLMGLLAARRSSGQIPWLSLVLLVDLAVLIGIALNRMSHLHDSAGFGRALFGIYLGLSCAHFVIDAGLWRLREEFPRTFLSERLPFLLAPTAN